METMDKINELNQIKSNATLLHSKEVIDEALAKLQSQLTSDYAEKNPIFLVVMNGGLIFAGKILPLLNFPIQIDYCHATRYRGATTGGEIEWRAKPQMDLSGRHVIVVDDILDEGFTLQGIVAACESMGALSVKTLVLIEKLHDRKAFKNMKPDYCELQGPDQYSFGAGMDYNHYWRNCDAIYLLNE
ncbi:hypoxanthine-guanine phosphoribosyltransferase [Aliikangiella marina]|uniref:Hypoxanthine-guanine phosphoribosyltransferase n=1 Tax=Aliikangiella marina TaxID=1712262 RepID=A0A545T4J2_9GAMM|nr:hypoxanthine-guanine phosphoribosyltransferase [Aliikangiella marina]TQV72147.1 hypoxanthine-guanine phosphoribosyltransferase [Aliikangiella marina]